jgi:hypothetical protein
MQQTAIAGGAATGRADRNLHLIGQTASDLLEGSRVGYLRKSAWLMSAPTTASTPVCTSGVEGKVA